MTAVVAVIMTLALVAWVIWPIVKRPASAPASGATPRCPNCGPRPEDDAKYCSNCGAPTRR